jgi:hypothetical protein
MHTVHIAILEAGFSYLFRKASIDYLFLAEDSMQMPHGKCRILGVGSASIAGPVSDQDARTRLAVGELNVVITNRQCSGAVSMILCADGEKAARTEASIHQSAQVKRSFTNASTQSLELGSQKPSPGPTARGVRLGVNAALGFSVANTK